MRQYHYWIVPVLLVFSFFILYIKTIPRHLYIKHRYYIIISALSLLEGITLSIKGLCILYIITSDQVIVRLISVILLIAGILSSRKKNYRFIKLMYEWMEK